MVELLRHLCGCASNSLFVGLSLYELLDTLSASELPQSHSKSYQTECLVDTVDHALPILSMLYRIPEAFLLFLQVLQVRIFRVSTEVLRRRNAIVNPGWPTNEISNGCPRQSGHLRNYLNARGAVTNNGDPLVGIVEIVVPSGRVCDMALEI